MKRKNVMSLFVRVRPCMFVLKKTITILAIFAICEVRSFANTADEILKETEIKGGLIVHLGCGDGKLTSALYANKSYIVHGLDSNSANIAKSREYIKEKGIYGKVSVEHWDKKFLPYTDNLVNLLISENIDNISQEEILRVLAPYGVAYIKTDGKWNKTIKPYPKEMDEWNHFLYGANNNAVSKDSLVGPPRTLQWISGQVFGRHHSHSPSISVIVTAKGRIFSIEDYGPPLSKSLPGDWHLIARNAFNGVTLWDIPIQKYKGGDGFRNGPVQLQRRLVAIKDKIYVVLNDKDSLLCIDGATGKTLHTYEDTKGINEILYSNGILYLSESRVRIDKINIKKKQTERKNENGRIIAIEAISGKKIWENSSCSILSGTLTVGDEKLFYHTGTGLTALELNSGKMIWEKQLPTTINRPGYSAPTIVYHDGVVLCGDRAVELPSTYKNEVELKTYTLVHGSLGLLTAFSAKDGSELWKEETAESFHSPVDIFIINNLVWATRGPAKTICNTGVKNQYITSLKKLYGEKFYIEDTAGRDLLSGKIKKRIDATNVFSLATHHHRCYRNKATENYILLGRHGVEFINLNDGPTSRNSWIRGMCQYGVMPANGLLYVPPDACKCNISNKINGFLALNAKKEKGWNDSLLRLDRGIDYDVKIETKAKLNDWTTYRHDNERSSSGGGVVADTPSLLWNNKLKGKLSPPIVADGKVFVSEIDEFTIHSFSLSKGEKLWSYIAGSRIDSPPTYWRGRVYFGSANGYITCLNATNGNLIWRYLIAPNNNRIMVHNRVESNWTTAGSVLIKNGIIYAFAGRSSHIDGGIYFVKLDALTGEMQLKKQIYLRDSETGKQDETHFKNGGAGGMDIPGVLYDIPASIDESIYLRNANLSLDGDMIFNSTKKHLFSLGGFLDNNYFHRYYMIYNHSAKGLNIPNGCLLVYDDNNIYGYGRKPSYSTKYNLFCSPKKNDKKSSSELWSDMKFPIMVWAMALSGIDNDNKTNKHLVVGGLSSKALTKIEILNSKDSGIIAIVDAVTGKILSQKSIDSRPVFDGICIGQGHIICSLKSGKIICLK